MARARRPRVAAIALPLALTMGGLSMASAQAEPAAVTVTVDLGTTVVESFLGLGVQWDPFYYRPSDEDWQMIVSRMDYCSPGFLRVMWGARSYCHGFDADGRPRYAWDEADPARRAGLEDLCRILEWAQSRGVEVILGEWGPPYGEIGGPTDLRWVQVIADSLSYLHETRGFTCISMYNLINEPNGDWSGNKDYGTWLTGVTNLRAELDARGMAATVRVIGPDTTGNTEWTEPFDWLDWAARDAAHVIGAWDLHWYAMDKEVLGGAIERTLRDKRESTLRTDPAAIGKPMFLGESGLIDGRCNIDQQPRVRSFEYGVMMADYVAQVARAGWMGATAWDLDDAMHPCKGDPPANPPDDLTLKVWGFWNSQADRMGHPEDKAMRPWFTTWALMSRLLPRGARILATETGDTPRFRAVAGAIRRVDADRVTVMLVNNDDAPRTVTVRVPGARSAPAVTEYRFYEDDRPVDADGFPRPAAVLRDVDLAAGYTLEMPSRGVIFLTTLGE